MSTKHEKSIDIALSLATITYKMGRIYRATRFQDGQNESDAEHSFMLGLVATELASSYYPALNIKLIGELARVHDLIELHLDDMPTFTASDETLARKRQAEEKALTNILTELPPYTASLLKKYEAQDIPEARFVRYIDKFMPHLVNIIGGTTVKQMNEIYSITTRREFSTALKTRHAKFETLGREFPLVDAFAQELHAQLEEAWIQEGGIT